MNDLVSLLATLGLLVGVYWIMFRRSRSHVERSAAPSFDWRAIAFAGVALKFGSLVFHEALTDVSFPLLSGTALLAVLHGLRPHWVELSFTLVVVPVLVIDGLRGDGAHGYEPALALWIIMVVGLTALFTLLLRLPLIPFQLLTPGKRYESMGNLATGFAGIVAFGFDLFDPIWQIGIERWFTDPVATIWFFIAGVILVAGVVATPRFTAAALGVGLIASEIAVRGIFCGTAVDAIPGSDCTSSVLILVTAFVFLVVRGFVAKRCEACEGSL